MKKTENDRKKALNKSELDDIIEISFQEYYKKYGEEITAGREIETNQLREVYKAMWLYGIRLESLYTSDNSTDFIKHKNKETSILMNKFNQNILDFINFGVEQSDEVTQDNLKESHKSIESLVSKAIKGIEEASNKEGYNGVSTGFSKLDELTFGWQPSDLIIIGGRPGMGKTPFATSMVKNIAVDFDVPVALFSLHRTSIQLVNMMMSNQSGISSRKLKEGKLDEHEWEILNNRTKKLSDSPMFLDDTSSLSVFDLREKARRLVSQHGVKIIVIDYLQLIMVEGEDREQEMSIILSNLKAISKEFNIPVVVLSQLSRSVENRDDKRPLLSDFREGELIDQYADVISFIFRPEYYGLTEWDDEEQNSCKNQAEFIIAKHRDGRLENIRLNFYENLNQFSDWFDYSGGLPF